MPRRLSEHKAVENPGVKWAESHGVKVTKTVALGRAGWPDRTFWFYGGRPFMAELKSPGCPPSPLQLHTIKELKELGYDVEVFDNKESFIQALQVRYSISKCLKKRHETDRRL